MRIRVATLLLLIIAQAYISFSQPVREITKGNIHFNSNAPNEIIKASSNQLKGVLDLTKKTFAFKVAVSSFEGFNSPLQKEHFNENYMESFNYPEITFSGKIIEDVNLAANAVYKIIGQPMS